MLAVIFLVAIAIRRSAGADDLAPMAVRRFLEGPYAPVVAGLVSILVTVASWGSLAAEPLYHDEAAYLHQARTFANGWLAAPPPPIGEFFEQYHVFVTPTFSAKYPPGHALLLVPGIWLGLPGLVPVLLGGLAGALLFAVARRVSGIWVAALAVPLWLMMPLTMRFRGSYFSEVTTAALVLASGWFLLEYRDTRRTRWLAALAGVVAWGGITRPLTMLAFAIPVGVAALVVVVRGRRWRDVAVALPVGLLVLGIAPLWSARVLGDWRLTPHAEYARQYMPADKVGFATDRTPAARPLSTEMAVFNDWVIGLHEEHTLGALPETARSRVREIGRAVWPDAAPALAALALAGVIFAGWAVAAVAAGGALMLFVAYLAYAHQSIWTIYYYELTPIPALFVAIGAVRLGLLIGERLAPRWHRLVGTSAAYARQLSLGGLALALVVGAWSLLDETLERRVIARAERGYPETFGRMIRSLPPGRKYVVFVRYAPGHNAHRSLVANEPDLQAARVWIVHDRGAENARLVRAAPDRMPLLYAETVDAGGMRRSLVPLASAEQPPAHPPAP